jgi:hypothetical protein
MIRDDSNEQATQLTPCGRVPGTPLDIRHEIVAQALVRGATNYEAGVKANYKIGPGLAGNISRLRRTPEMRERMAEIIEIAEEDARIENRWLVADLHTFRKASLANFWKRDRHGKLVLRRASPLSIFHARPKSSCVRSLRSRLLQRATPTATLASRTRRQPIVECNVPRFSNRHRGAPHTSLRRLRCFGPNGRMPRRDQSRRAHAARPTRQSIRPSASQN